ncbi:pyridoxamine 5'-phosphate oxidase [Streptomyces sp. NPDC093111]|uniref:pyridoxamine 5'-phosphate oxidase n=1 Tax=Streptomyces sp. NPDC093111 TaxID=3154978 RepID=UPI0034356C87
MNTDGPPDRLRAALAAHTTLALAYTDDDGPQACAVFHAVTDTGSLVFLTARSTRHGAALARQAPGARVAFTAHRDAQKWSSLTGLQGRGLCERATGPALAAARAAYARRFPFVATAGRLAQALSRADHWEIHPTWLRLVDNSRGFGHKTEWSV